MVAMLVYVLCAITSGLCAFLLLRHYRRSHAKLLLGSGICFICFALSNVLLFLDLVVFPDVDLSLYRNSLTLLGLVVLMHGLIFKTD
jgi:hypothetical protein